MAAGEACADGGTMPTWVVWGRGWWVRFSFSSGRGGNGRVLLVPRVCGRCWSEGEGRRREEKRPGARQAPRQAVLLVFRGNPRFERIFPAKMTGLP